MQNLILYPQLSTRSRRAIKRVRGRFGHPYTYNPRGTLLERLARDNGLTIQASYEQLLRERQALIQEGDFSLGL